MKKQELEEMVLTANLSMVMYLKTNYAVDDMTEDEVRQALKLYFSAITSGMTFNDFKNQIKDIIE